VQRAFSRFTCGGARSWTSDQLIRGSRWQPSASSQGAFVLLAESLTPPRPQRLHLLPWAAGCLSSCPVLLRGACTVDTMVPGQRRHLHSDLHPPSPRINIRLRGPLSANWLDAPTGPSTAARTLSNHRHPQSSTAEHHRYIGAVACKHPDLI
jgi:hypothetical protein